MATPITDFYVKPLGGFDIGKRVTEIGERIKNERKLESMKKQAASVFKSGDTDAIAEFMLLNPEMSQVVQDAINFKDTKTKQNAVDSAIAILQGKDPKEILQNRVNMVAESGGNPQHTQASLDRVQAGEDVRQEALETLALLDQQKYNAYVDAVGSKEPLALKDRYKVVGDRLVDLASPGKPSVVIDAAKKDTPPTLLEKGIVKVGNSLVSLKDPDKPREIFKVKDMVTPYSATAELKADLDNGFIDKETYDKLALSLIAPKYKNKTDLTLGMLAGEPTAIAALAAMKKETIDTAEQVAGATMKGKIKGLETVLDVDAIAQAVEKGQTLLSDVKNTFGVPIQTIVMNKVLEKNPKFNFLLPEAVTKSLSSSLIQQQKNRGSMGSFVTNINSQVTRVEEISTALSNRWGIRALDKPIMEFKKMAIGSGDEQILNAYTKEISAEIAKLAQGSSGSVAQLPEANREEWEHIHDPSLTIKELIKILNATRDMANMRIESVNKEIDYTVGLMSDIPNTIKSLRGTQETYRGINNPTATGPNGEKLELVNGTWRPYNGK